MSANQFCASCWNYLDACDCHGNPSDISHLVLGTFSSEKIPEEGTWYFLGNVKFILEKSGELGLAISLKLPHLWTQNPPVDGLLAIPPSALEAKKGVMWDDYALWSGMGYCQGALIPRFCNRKLKEDVLSNTEVRNPMPWELDYFRPYEMPSKENPSAKDIKDRCKKRNDKLVKLSTCMAREYQKERIKDEIWSNVPEYEDVRTNIPYIPTTAKFGAPEWQGVHVPPVNPAWAIAIGGFLTLPFAEQFLPELFSYADTIGLDEGSYHHWLEHHLSGLPPPDNPTQPVDKYAGMNFSDLQTLAEDNPYDPSVLPSEFLRSAPKPPFPMLLDGTKIPPPRKPINVIEPNDPKGSSETPKGGGGGGGPVGPPPEVIPPGPETIIPHYKILKFIPVGYCIGQVPQFLNTAVPIDYREYPHLTWGAAAPPVVDGSVWTATPRLSIPARSVSGHAVTLACFRMSHTAEAKRCVLTLTKTTSDTKITGFNFRCKGRDTILTGNSCVFEFTSEPLPGCIFTEVRVTPTYANANVQTSHWAIKYEADWDIDCKPIARIPRNICVPDPDPFPFNPDGSCSFGLNTTEEQRATVFYNMFGARDPPFFIINSGEVRTRTGNEAERVLKANNTGDGGSTPTLPFYNHNLNALRGIVNRQREFRDPAIAASDGGIKCYIREWSKMGPRPAVDIAPVQDEVTLPLGP